MQALMDYQQSVFPWMRMFTDQSEYHFDTTPFMVMGAVCGLIGMMVQLYFLITRKFAFEKAAADLKSGVIQA